PFQARLGAVRGRGGTDFRPVLDPAFWRKHRPAVIAYFTDGCGPAPPAPPPCPLLWCLTPGGHRPADSGPGGTPPPGPGTGSTPRSHLSSDWRAATPSRAGPPRRDVPLSGTRCRGRRGLAHSGLAIRLLDLPLRAEGCGAGPLHGGGQTENEMPFALRREG